MDKEIKLIEDLSLNAWPSHQMQIYDNWILRFSYFYTHRTNSVEQLGASTLPLDEKIAYCESIYRDWGTPCIFKINPFLVPAFDNLLDKRHYEIEHVTEVMVMDIPDISALAPVPDVHVLLDPTIPDEWIYSLFDLKEMTNKIHRKIVPSMYHAIPKRTIAAHIEAEGRYVATGLGILDRDYIGIYAIHVDPAFRRRHFAEAICKSILAQGRRQGAKKAYLQVVQGNTPARTLYENLGFSQLYTYWFRVSPYYI